MNEFELSYRGKEDSFSVIRKTEPAELEDIKTFLYGRKIIQWTKPYEKFVNMLFFGDNLKILRNLIDRKDLKGKIKLIYIDPPFSTNNIYRSGSERVSTISSSKEDRIAYEDTYQGAEYIEFLRKRLILLREILADDGSIYLHIDEKIGHYVKIIMDEIFGKENFINHISRIKCNPKNFKRSAYGNIKDVILFYSKTDSYIWNDSKEDYTEDEINRLFRKIDNQGRRYTTNPIHAPGETKNGPTGQPWKGLNPQKGRHWRYHPDRLTELDEKGLIEWSRNGNPRIIIYADEYKKKKKKRQDIWLFKDPPYPKYPTEKNEELIKMIIQASSNPSDIVLDSFAGSGTTLTAAEKLNRKWIGIDNSPVAIETTINRILKIQHHQPFVLISETRKTQELKFLAHWSHTLDTENSA